MKKLGKRRFALASITALFGSVAACSGSSAFIDDVEDSGSGVTTSPTSTTTATGTSTGNPPPPLPDASSDHDEPIDAGSDVETVPDASEDAGVEDSGVVEDAGVEDAGIEDAGPVDSGPATCLDPTPIDQTQFRYQRAVAPVKGACAAKELNAFSAYYKAHGNDDDFTMKAWADSVSNTCSACIFTDETKGPVKAWRSIIIADDELQKVNRGGCVEIVSGSVACGRAYDQFQECTLAACTSRCTTREDFSACRQDPTVLTTACKDAFEAVQKQCGDDIGSYETSCRGTTYTFEGPIRVSCVTGWPATGKDAGIIRLDSGNRIDASDADDVP